MVNLKLLLAGYLLLWSAAGWSASSSLTVELDRHSLELGRYLQATIRYQGSQSLEDLNLEVWRETAAIYPFDEFTETDAAGKRLQVIQFRLYPRHEGQRQLPALEFDKTTSQPQSFKVNAPQVDGHPINLEWSVSSHDPWQRELITIRTQLTTSDPTAHVVLDPLDDRSMASETLMERTKDAGGFRHEGGWLLYALNHGEALIDLPPLRYRLSGSDQRWFHLPLINLKIRPLPPYLPPNLPVGKVEINSALTKDSQSWEVRLTGRPLLSRGVPGLDMTLAQHGQQSLSAVSFHASRSPDINNPVTHGSYQVPLPDWLSPIGPSLSLTLRYFDTEAGRLVTRSHPLPRTLRLPDWAWSALWVILAAILAAIIFRLWPGWLAWQQNRRLRKQINQLDSPRQLRHALLSNSGLTHLGEWAGQHSGRLPFAASLNQACFSGQAQDIGQLRCEAARLLKTL